MSVLEMAERGVEVWTRVNMGLRGEMVSDGCGWVDVVFLEG